MLSFSSDDGNYIPLISWIKFPHIIRFNFEILNKDVIDVEVWKAIFDVVASKAPMGDGYSALFYQVDWDKFGSPICSFAKDYFFLTELLSRLWTILYLH